MPGDLTNNFSRWEFACKDLCGLDCPDRAFVDHLQAFRNHVGVPVHVNSGCRCEAYQKDMLRRGYKPSPNSKHLLSLAADIVVDGLSPVQVACIAWRLGFRGVKAGGTYTHVDDRTGPRWYEGFALGESPESARSL